MTAALRTVRSWHGPLALFAGAMAALAVVCLAAWVVDDRTVVGQPLWAKPLKFALSFGAYAVTLAWMLSQLKAGRRFGWWAGTIVALASAVELVAIVTQVVRGRQSHFNESTPLDSNIYGVMGASVAVIYLGTLVVAVLLLRTRSVDPALTLALRLGVAIAVAGMSVGFLMVRPSAEQELVPVAERSIVGAHSVGVSDGGPGLPLMGWSTIGGDLRVGHFIGMHALQVLPLLALALGSASASRLDDRSRRRIVALAAVAYGGVTALAVWQARRGQPVTAPDAATLLAAAALLAVTALGILAITRTRQPLLAVA